MAGNIDGSNKLSGSTNMQFDTGGMLSYTIEASINNEALKVNNMLKRASRQQ